MNYSSDIAFTDTVKSIQTRKGSRDAYASMEQNGSWETFISPRNAEFITDQRSFFLATTNKQGQPYIQHRGGPKGFLKVLDEKTLAFADYTGNQQFISQGNLIENPRAFIFLIDFANRRRVKIWGTAEFIEDDQTLLESLMPPSDEYQAKPEQVFKFTVEAIDRNCPQHIPQRFDREDVESLMQQKDQTISILEQQVGELEAQLKAEMDN
ncbi:pyridoxamine 5'-phosphate oxidase family protein [Endozoicomonadaceae bacterium StTr2]